MTHEPNNAHAEPSPDARATQAADRAANDDLYRPSPQRALALAVADVERHASRQGWDGPVYVFALVNTAQALADDPGLAELLPPDALEAAEEDPFHLTSIEQDGLPDARSLEQLLAQLAWPETVLGAAISVERVVVPPEAEQQLPQDDDAAIAALLEHPERQDVRMVAGVLRSGETWCAMRMRTHDRDEDVLSSPDAVPGLLAALQATFER